ncbi:MAG: prepilin-type N-terminal cleavage/methylation domain-containing protein [Longimicrobiales bacterium]|nr:prepilin-type N-terminal cleavage/methylation domain-containing protein [Longimicrobiales bacterium]
MRGGFTLIEVIVALIILELGLLGVAGLALHAHGLLSEASFRSRAVAVAAEIADSLASAGVRSGGTRSFVGGSASWEVDEASVGGVDAGAPRRVLLSVVDSGGAGALSARFLVPGAELSGGP